MLEKSEQAIGLLPQVIAAANRTLAARNLLRTATRRHFTKASDRRRQDGSEVLRFGNSREPSSLSVAYVRPSRLALPSSAGKLKLSTSRPNIVTIFPDTAGPKTSPVMAKPKSRNNLATVPLPSTQQQAANAFVRSIAATSTTLAGLAGLAPVSVQNSTSFTLPEHPTTENLPTTDWQRPTPDHSGGWLAMNLENIILIGMFTIITLIVSINMCAVVTLSYGIFTPIGPLTIRTMYFFEKSRSVERRGSTTVRAKPSGSIDNYYRSRKKNFTDPLSFLSPRVSDEGADLMPWSEQKALIRASAITSAINQRRLEMENVNADKIPKMDCSTFPYLLSLAVSDLIIGVVIAPLQLQLFVNNGRWTLRPEFCDLWRAADIFFCTSSALHTAVIAVDRWWALTKKNSKYRWLRRANMQRKMLIFPWFLGAMISFPVMYVWQIESPETNEEQRNTETCSPVMDNVYIILSAMVSFFLPLATTVSFYIQVALAMRKRLTQLQSEAGGILSKTADHFMANVNVGSSVMARKAADELESRNAQRQATQRRIKELKQHRHLLKSMSIVVLFYIICWAPLYTTLFIQAICQCAQPQEDSSKKVEVGPSPWDFWLSVFTWVGYANSFVNPVIYYCALPEFRLLSVTLMKLVVKCLIDQFIILWNKLRYHRYQRSVWTGGPGNYFVAAMVSKSSVFGSPCRHITPALNPSPVTAVAAGFSHPATIDVGCDVMSGSQLTDTSTQKTTMGTNESMSYATMTSISLQDSFKDGPLPYAGARTKEQTSCNGQAGENTLYAYYDEWGRPVNSSSKEATF